MPIAIAVTSADLVLPATDPHTPGAHVLTPPGEQDFPTALAETAGLLERHGHVIAVYPATTPRAHVQRLHAVRAMLESDRIALLSTSLPPLGAAVLVRQLRQLSVCDFSPGVLGAATRLLSHYIYAGALLGSAARTDRLPVPLPPVTGPRSAVSAPHAVLARPTAQLVPAGDRSGAAGLAGPQFATTLTYAAGRFDSAWVTGPLARQWQVQGCTRCRCPRSRPAGGTPPSWWSSPPPSTTPHCSTRWCPRCVRKPATGAVSPSSATAAPSVRRRCPPDGSARRSAAATARRWRGEPHFGTDIPNGRRAVRRRR